MDITPASQFKCRQSIELLPEHLIDQIKAGEVIERPASLVKELLENALDAKATKIKIHVIESGLELIQIEDNGVGMSFDELPLAFCRHATSKLKKFEDIYNLRSFGFRGEALASIASVAKVTCTSVPTDHFKNGGRYIVNGGKQISHAPYESKESGTSFYIKDLFYNTPARLKFIKSKNSEKNGLVRIINAFFLCSPETDFTLRWDDDEKHHFPSVSKENHAARISQVLLKAKRPKPEELYFLEQTYEDHRIVGYFSKSSSKGHAHKRQFLFANSRLFFDRGLHQMIVREMEKLWGHGESGHYCLFIEAPLNAIDVNVHPHKTQIKFFKSSLLFSLLSGSLKDLVKKNLVVDGHKLTSSSSEEEAFQGHYKEFTQGSLSQEPDRDDGAQITQNSHSLFFQRVSQRYALYKKSQEENFSLISLDQFLKLFLQEKWLKLHPFSEELTTPLLISEPFKIPKGSCDLHINDFKNFGLEIDRLDESTLVLRSIPCAFEELNYRLIVGDLLSQINSSQAPHQDLAEKISFFLQQNISKWPFPHKTLNAISDFIESKIQSSSPLDPKLLTSIDDHKLSKLFHSQDS